MPVLWLSCCKRYVYTSSNPRTRLRAGANPSGPGPPCTACFSRRQTYSKYVDREQNIVRSSCRCSAEEISADSPCEYGYQGSLLRCFWLLSVVWGVAVLGKVASATVTGSVVSWWFSPGVGSEGAVRGAIWGAVRVSFG